MSKVYTRTESSSQWAMNGNKIEFRTTTTNSTYDKTLREWVKSKPIITYETPEQRGYNKQAEFYVVTFSEIPSMRKRDLKEKLWFKEKVVAKIKDDNPHMYIILNSDLQNIQDKPTKVNQFYLREINRGMCFKMPLVDNEYVKIIKSEPEAITAKEAQELSQKWNYIFDSVESDNDGDIYRDNVTKYISNPM